jgi:hypothetical protein
LHPTTFVEAALASAVPPAANWSRFRRDLEEAIKADVERLAPGAMKYIEAGLSSEDALKTIAAGDVVVEPPA